MTHGLVISYMDENTISLKNGSEAVPAYIYANILKVNNCPHTFFYNRFSITSFWLMEIEEFVELVYLPWHYDSVRYLHKFNSQGNSQGRNIAIFCQHQIKVSVDSKIKLPANGQ